MAHLGVGMRYHPIRGHTLADRQAVPVDDHILFDDLSQ